MREEEEELDFDFAVIGLGAMGLACAAFLSKNGSVIGFDQHEFDHRMGSSACESKIFRFSCFEGEVYSKLAGRSFELWNDIAKETDTTLFLKTGVLMMGKEGSRVIKKTRESASGIGENLQELNSSDIKRRFPPFNIPKQQVGILDTNSGVLLPTPAHKALLNICLKNGAQTFFSTTVFDIEDVNKKIMIVRTENVSYKVRKVILCTGPWVNEWSSKILGKSSSALIDVQRIVPMWMQPKKKSCLVNYDAKNFPAYYWDVDGSSQLYGFPLIGEMGSGLIKVGLDNDRTSTSASLIDRSINDDEIERLRSIVERYMPSLNGKFAQSQPCMFSMSPDTDFIIGPFEDNKNVIVVGGFSGRGYKFVPAIGEMVCDLIVNGTSPYYSKKFDPQRFLNEELNEN